MRPSLGEAWGKGKMAEAELLKVTAFIVRRAAGGSEVLLIRHPFAGIQFPAGTVEAGEAPEAAALREADEETGLTRFGPPLAAGELVERLDPPRSLVADTTPIYFRPDLESVSWASLRRGIEITRHRDEAGFVHVTYSEFDRAPDPQYVTAQITGWAPEAAIAQVRRRFFYVLPFEGTAEPEWELYADNHHWTLFWAPLDALPPIIPPQDAWTPYLLAAASG